MRRQENRNVLTVGVSASRDGALKKILTEIHAGELRLERELSGTQRILMSKMTIF